MHVPYPKDVFSTMSVVLLADVDPTLPADDVRDAIRAGGELNYWVTTKLVSDSARPPLFSSVTRTRMVYAPGSHFRRGI
jgi:hypothetical protein